MKMIPLTQGKVALVDDDDYERVNQFKWYAQKVKNTLYAARRTPRDENGKSELIYMHNFLCGGPTDHIAPNSGLDNRKVNTRLATNQQNHRAFRTKAAGCSSQYRGVDWRKDCQKWRAKIKLTHGKQTHLGYFESEKSAARAYDAAALARDPVFHHLNFPA